MLDASRLVAGNQMTMLLGDFGADVIKIEQPGRGDTLRGWQVEEQPLYWRYYGRNKRSVTLDLKRDIAREAFLRLAETADVVVESFRPHGLESLRLGVPVLHARNDRLVVVRVSGWGLTGSLADFPGFGTLVEAMSGFAVMNGFPDREPVLPPIALADMVAGVYGAFATLMAVSHARRSGVGQVVDLSLFESLFSILGPTPASFVVSGEAPRRTGNRSPTSAPRNIYRTADDRWLALSATTQAMTARLFQAIGQPELIADERFADNRSRVANVEALDRILAEYFGRHTLRDDIATMRAAGVTAAAVADVGELLSSEYFRTRGVVVDVAQTDGSVLPLPDVVPRLSTTPGSIRRPAPEPGQHNEEILRAVLSDDEWAELLA